MLQIVFLVSFGKLLTRRGAWAVKFHANEISNDIACNFN
jgi:hypothetical protein